MNSYNLYLSYESYLRRKVKFKSSYFMVADLFMQISKSYISKDIYVYIYFFNFACYKVNVLAD